MLHDRTQPVTTTLSETADELRAVAASHGWSLDGMALFELLDEAGRLVFSCLTRALLTRR